MFFLNHFVHTGILFTFFHSDSELSKSVRSVFMTDAAILISFSKYFLTWQTKHTNYTY